MSGEIRINCPLLSREEISNLATRAEGRQRVVLDADVFRDLCLQAFAALEDPSLASRASRGRLRVLLAGVERAGAVDLPAEDLRLFCAQAMRAVWSD